MSKWDRLTPQASFQILGSALAGTLPVAAPEALKKAGIEPAILASHMPKVIEAMVPELATALVSILNEHGFAIVAREGNAMVTNIGLSMRAKQSGMRPTGQVQQAPQPVQAVQAPRVIPQNFAPAPAQVVTATPQQPATPDLTPLSEINL